MSIPSWVRAGVKVLSLYDFPDAVAAGFRAPMKGKVYTIREVDQGPGFYDCIRVVEITNGLCNDGWEPSWVIRHFRPLVTRSKEHDVAIFAPLLNQPAPKRSKVVAAGVRVPHHGEVS